jgi:hypothetical protein
MCKALPVIGSTSTKAPERAIAPVLSDQLSGKPVRVVRKMASGFLPITPLVDPHMPTSVW